MQGWFLGEPVSMQAEWFVSTAETDDHGGERYPALERVNGVPAVLDEITKPLTTPEKAPAEEMKDAEQQCN